MNIQNIPIIILSGGASKRVGSDKSLLRINNKTLAQYQYDRLKTYFKNVYISAKSDKFDFKADLIFDTNTIYSPLVALETILTMDFERFFVIPVDTPLLSIDTIKDLISQSIDYDIVVAQSDDKIHYLCAVFTKDIYPKVQEMIKEDNHKIKELIRHFNHKIIQYQDKEEEFLNINYKEDYYKFLKNIIH